MRCELMLSGVGDGEERDDSLYGVPSRTAKPIYRSPQVAILFDFGIEIDADGESGIEPFDLGDPLLKQLVESLPEGGRVLKRLPDRPPLSQSMHWALVLGTVAAFWQLSGLPGAIQIGQRMHAWLRGAKGRSGDAGALLPVAIWHVTQTFARAKPNPERVQILSPLKQSRFPRDHQVVFLHRIYDLDGATVYVVEVTSLGDLVSCSARPIGMFENPDHTGETDRPEASEPARYPGAA